MNPSSKNVFFSIFLFHGTPFLREFLNTIYDTVSFKCNSFSEVVVSCCRKKRRRRRSLKDPDQKTAAQNRDPEEKEVAKAKAEEREEAKAKDIKRIKEKGKRRVKEKERTSEAALMSLCRKY